MRILDDTFPLLVAIGPKKYDQEAVDLMSRAYEPYFKRNERYALISVAPRDASMPGPKERKLITDWTNSARVRDCSARLCIGSATVVPNTLARGALTALLWFWTPPSPLQPVATVDEALDYCLGRLRAEGLPLRAGEQAVRKLVREQLRDIL